MKVAIVHNQEEKTLKILPELMECLASHQIEIDADHPEVVISVGGDGTLLSAFHRFNHRLNEVQFLGIHTGHLGFYTDWRDYELVDMVESLKKNGTSMPSIQYPLLDVVVHYRDKENSGHFLALNESVIRRVGKTMVADVLINDRLFEHFRGDGLVVSTPTGSTAYNKSIGGAILHPELPAFQLTEIASLNNIVFRTLGSSMVIAENDWVTIIPDSADDYHLSVDQLAMGNRDIEKITYRLAAEKIQFVATRHLPFFTRVKDAFIGEV
ncbi:NAD kinase [Enterococcus timonensis]|uniref:NAD kinase n=1 Tax=Enterococcus timonensis TaxID=1852364 RepID=UPI0008DA944A|nr:NAD kinase [Enterococcus timonensis]